MKDFFKRLFEKRGDEEFVALMQVALEDPTVRLQLMKILELPSPRRRTALRKWRQEIGDEKAPDALIKVIAFLEQDEIVELAIKLLNNK